MWGQEHSFAGLPQIIKNNNGQMVELLYRVVEQEIIYDGIIQKAEVAEGATTRTYTYQFADGLFAPAYWANGRTEPWSASETEYNNSLTRNLYNRLETTELTITKIWQGDNDNIYGTRPETGRTNYDWQTSFVLQRSADGGQTWQNVQVLSLIHISEPTRH